MTASCVEKSEESLRKVFQTGSLIVLVAEDYMKALFGNILKRILSDLFGKESSIVDYSDVTSDYLVIPSGLLFLNIIDGRVEDDH